MSDWLGTIALTLVSAIAYNDRADGKWWHRVSDPKASLEDLANSGGERFEHRDAMLADGLEPR